MIMRLLTYNIRYGGRGHEAELAAVIRAADPDIVLLQEATDRDVIGRLAGMTGLPNWDARPRSSTSFMTRLDVVAYDWILPRGSRHSFLEVAIANPEVRLFGLHLSAWFNDWTERRRTREIKALLDSIRKHQNGLHLIAGDFNALAPGAELNTRAWPGWIRTMVWLSGGNIARSTIQHMLDEQYIDVWRALNDGNAGNTFPVWNPQVRLDYIFTPERYQPSLRTCRIVTDPPEAKTASDHFPLLAELEV
jgi:endonuclease/exonuclease/phosphatase family metal-dependent hydrolase